MGPTTSGRPIFRQECPWFATWWSHSWGILKVKRTVPVQVSGLLYLSITNARYVLMGQPALVVLIRK